MTEMYLNMFSVSENMVLALFSGYAGPTLAHKRVRHAKCTGSQNYLDCVHLSQNCTHVCVHSNEAKFKRKFQGQWGSIDYFVIGLASRCMWVGREPEALRGREGQDHLYIHSSTAVTQTLSFFLLTALPLRQSQVRKYSQEFRICRW